jgi:peroxiredoxin
LLTPRQPDEHENRLKHELSEGEHPCIGRLLPSVVLPGWPIPSINLLKQWRGSSLLLSAYPGAAAATGVDRRDEYLLSWAVEAGTLNGLGYDIALISTDPVESTSTAIGLLGTPFTTIADENLALARALELPTSSQFGADRYEELTLVVHEGEITQVFKADGATDVRSEVATVLRFLREVHG